MPRYFFHVDLPPAEADLIGDDLPDLQSAKCAAIQMVANTLCKHPQAFWDADAHQIRISDQSGLTLFMIDITTTAAPVLGIKLPDAT